MAKPTKAKANKKKKGGSAPHAAGPTAVLYRLDPGCERGDKVREVLSELGIRARTVTEEQLGNQVGFFAGMTGFRPSRRPYEGEPSEEEFMLLANLSGKQTDELLAAMREADVVVDHKAQVTEYNRMWTIGMLMEQIAREHAQLTQQQSSQQPLQSPQADAE